ncbi:solute carrier family 28 member 3-like isoform X2 [Pomacea canaliculata]|uniref:solute carrier family 28 member 3-like isoform X2 n=1 Tax=Pomacea canaliculata TaxID=400727 RepID=UPI000D732880|nr:solute carrier family 28 member 3-like isoform X2 [Pomacea canaliculata]
MGARRSARSTFEEPLAMAVELKNISALRNGVDNPSFDTTGDHSDGIMFKIDDTNANKMPKKPEEEASNIRIQEYEEIENDENDEDQGDDGPCSRAVGRTQDAVIKFYSTHKRIIVNVFLAVLFLVYMTYFAYCMWYSFGDEGSIRLLVGTILGVFLIALHYLGDYFNLSKALNGTVRVKNKAKLRKIIRWVLYVISAVAMVTVLIVLVAIRTPSNLVSLGGLAAFILLSYITSFNPAKVNWHPVYWGFCVQFLFAGIILRTRVGYQIFDWLGSRVTEFLNYASAGAIFVFGDVYQEHFFAFAILPVIVFFSAAISTLYFLGVMQGIVKVLGRFLSFCLGTTPAESLNAAANIFVGMTEAPLMIRPFISRMTKSELHAVMTGGFATIAGSVLGAYIGFGVPADHLLSASVMSAPAALAISKLTYPETEVPQMSDEDYSKMEDMPEKNLIEAASSGASASIQLVANVAVNVMAFLSILAFVNATLNWFGERAGVAGVSFQFICSYVLYPVALFMGTELADCRRIAELVGIKTFTNEFIAYASLRDLIANHKTWTNYTSIYDPHTAGNVQYISDDIFLTHWNMTLTKGIISRRSEIIATYALCGFSNFGSMGIMLGALTGMAPDRKKDLASIVLRAMIAGNIACFFTACIAGLFFEDYK